MSAYKSGPFRPAASPHVRAALIALQSPFVCLDGGAVRYRPSHQKAGYPTLRVSELTRRSLVKNGWVEQDRYGRWFLTEQGRRVAGGVVGG